MSNIKQKTERLKIYRKALENKLDSESFRKSIKRKISKIIREIRTEKIKKIFNK